MMIHDAKFQMLLGMGRSYTHVEWLFNLGYHPRSYTLVKWLFMGTREPPFMANMMSSHHISSSIHQAESFTNFPALRHENLPLPSAKKKILKCPALKQKILPLSSVWYKILTMSSP